MERKMKESKFNKLYNLIMETHEMSYEKFPEDHEFGDDIRFETYEECGNAYTVRRNYTWEKWKAEQKKLNNKENEIDPNKEYPEVSDHTAYYTLNSNTNYILTLTGAEIKKYRSQFQGKTFCELNLSLNSLIKRHKSIEESLKIYKFKITDIEIIDRNEFVTKEGSERKVGDVKNFCGFYVYINNPYKNELPFDSLLNLEEPHLNENSTAIYATCFEEDLEEVKNKIIEMAMSIKESSEAKNTKQRMKTTGF
jgi:hypothetical protein